MSDYISVSTFKSRVGITTSTDDTRIAEHITAASLWVDAYCGRTFTVFAVPGPGNAVTRYFRPDSFFLCRVDDCHDIQSVKLDTADDGTYATTLTEGTDYITHPINGVGPDGQEGWPIMQIELTGRTYRFPLGNYRPLSVAVLAEYGWDAIPDEIAEATFLLAHRLYYEVDVPSGNVPGSVEFGGVPLRAPRTAQILLNRYRRSDRIHGIAG